MTLTPELVLPWESITGYGIFAPLLVAFASHLRLPSSQWRLQLTGDWLAANELRLGEGGGSIDKDLFD